MINASPFAKNIIKKNNINIEEIKGSGPNGKIIKRDLIKHNLIPNDVKSLNNDIKIKETIPSSIRKIIAEKTTDSFKNIPHFYLKIESKIDKLINLKDTINSSEKNVKVSLNDLLIKALAIAQKNNPKTLVSWIDNKMIHYTNVDVSFAVALDEGLITPIIKNADTKGILEISSEVRKLIKIAKNKELLPEQYTGGTISISNLGMYGISEFGAIINPPQSCILAIGQAKQQVIVEKNNFSKATILKSTLSADHRVLDGATAANLLKNFHEVIENPLEIWINSDDMKLN
tara:strand:- start:352 stop:1215 length:864 start_codon:yes stop_codon:yes gene_type:complete